MSAQRLLARNCSRPFYDNGPNDKGIGIQLAYSLGRVLTGYLLAVAGGGADRVPDRHVAADAGRA